VAAAGGLGFSGPDWDFNGEKQEGAVGFYQKTIKAGKRHSAAACLPHAPPAPRQPGVRTRAPATRLLLERNRVVGVEYRNGDEILPGARPARSDCQQRRRRIAKVVAAFRTGAGGGNFAPTASRSSLICRGWAGTCKTT